MVVRVATLPVTDNLCFVVQRYGNVMASGVAGCSFVYGAVKRAPTITDPTMTRFMMTQEDAS